MPTRQIDMTGFHSGGRAFLHFYTQLAPGPAKGTMQYDTDPCHRICEHRRQLPGSVVSLRRHSQSIG